MKAYVFMKNGVVHFYNESGEYSKLRMIAYELGHMLSDFASFETEYLNHNLLHLVSLYKVFSFLDSERLNSPELWNKLIDSTKDALDMSILGNIYLYFYHRALLKFAIEYLQDKKQAIEKFSLFIDDKLEAIDEELDFYSVLKIAKDHLLSHAASKILFAKNELTFLAEISRHERISKFNPMQKIAYMDLKRPDKTKKYFYLKTDLKMSYIVAHKNLHSENTENITWEDIIIVEKHDISYIEDLIRFEMMELIKSKTPIKECKNCGNYFIPVNRSDTEYCSRIPYSEIKPCREIGATKQYEQKITGDPVYKAYNKAYKRNNSRVRNNTLSQQNFYNWAEQARQMRDDCKSGKISLDEFQEWLNCGKKRNRKSVETTKKQKRYVHRIHLSALLEYFLKMNNELHKYFYFDTAKGEFYIVETNIAIAAYKKFSAYGDNSIVFADENSEKIAVDYWERRHCLVPLPGIHETFLTDEMIKRWSERYRIQVIPK